MFDPNLLRNSGVYLIVTTDHYFYESTGAQFKALWGLCKVVEARELFGFKPTGSANWYLKVGEGENDVFIAGCQIHYAQHCPEPPNSKDILIVR